MPPIKYESLVNSIVAGFVSDITAELPLNPPRGSGPQEDVKEYPKKSHISQTGKYPPGIREENISSHEPFISVHDKSNEADSTSLIAAIMSADGTLLVSQALRNFSIVDGVSLMLSNKRELREYTRPHWDLSINDLTHSDWQVKRQRYKTTDVRRTEVKSDMLSKNSRYLIEIFVIKIISTTTSSAPTWTQLLELKTRNAKGGPAGPTLPILKPYTNSDHQKLLINEHFPVSMLLSNLMHVCSIMDYVASDPSIIDCRITRPSEWSHQRFSRWLLRPDSNPQPWMSDRRGSRI